ncbi:MAG: hypothetical protein CBB61_009910 [Gammaproteobacteria bacterium TMED1]|nr:MAG: hypothetical protein CBB61_009910 [Gammaproteobacteria bacterium TMED1]
MIVRDALHRSATHQRRQQGKLLKRGLKFTISVVTGIVIVGVVGTMSYWGYLVYKYGQHLPTVEIMVNGGKREYNRFIPENPPEGPLSLVVLLNGGGVEPWPFPQQRQWEALGEEFGIALAVPVGKRLPENESAWQLNTDDDSYQDIDFINAMISDIGKTHPLDDKKIYAVGFSLGSMFSYELACQMSDQFAAIASFAGTMPVIKKSCNPQVNVPIMHIHGLKDPIIAYGNTWEWKEWDSVGEMHDVPGLLQFWRDRYQCQNKTVNENIDEVHIVYENCDQGARVEHYRLVDGGHGWPQTLGEVSTHRVIWSFFNNVTTP